MKNDLLMEFTVDKETNTVFVNREFAANRDMVWDAWTKPELLDIWWAPKPWTSHTKSMDFSVGGNRLYAMRGPEGEEHWAFSQFTSIDPKDYFGWKDGFCDSDGNINTEMPQADWSVNFIPHGQTTLVKMVMKHETWEDVETIINMGFKEGFTMALQNLDQYIESKFKLWIDLRTDNIPRVSSYLNFPGTTEAAFNFYKEVFQSEFKGTGIQRFEDIPQEPGNPPIAENVKKMVLHIELPILNGSHILMATDAPKEMGFELQQGTNMHICLEPETREETARLFHALSEGGRINMPLEDMFFGAYYGSCTDKFGINWMFNHKNN